MTGGPSGLEQAKLDAREAKGRFTATLGEIQERLSPRVLLHGAWSDIRERGDQAAGDAIDLARNRPAATAGIAAAIAVVLLRHPLSRAVASLFSSKRETEADDEKLKADKPAAQTPPRRRRAATIAKGD